LWHKTISKDGLQFDFDIFLFLSVSHDFKNTQMSFGKPQIWQKNKKFAKIIENQQVVVFVTISSTDL
jgi:hypothetical protein